MKCNNYYFEEKLTSIMHVIYWYITYESKNIMIVESLVNQIHKIAQEVVEDRNIMKNEKEKERIPKYLYVKPL